MSVSSQNTSIWPGSVRLARMFVTIDNGYSLASEASRFAMNHAFVVLTICA